MKKLIIIFSFALSILIVSASECTLPVAVLPSQQSEDVPEASVQYLNDRLKQILATEGIVSDPGLSPFVVTAKFNHIMQQTLPGPPVQTALRTYLTLYMGDITSETVYYASTVELRGVGTSPQRAFINALRSVNDVNAQIQDFVSKAKTKVIDYYDANYEQIIQKAKLAASQHYFERALWILSPVPECCKGYTAVSKLMATYYQCLIDREGDALYQSALAAWAVDPTDTGAFDAFGYLIMIDPESSAYNKAMALANEIKSTVKADKDFEMRQKYADKIDLEKRRIESARAVGVAYGNGQKPITTNLNWIR